MILTSNFVEDLSEMFFFFFNKGFRAKVTHFEYIPQLLNSHHCAYTTNA